MKKGIHPEYHEINVTCVCGAKYQTKSTANFSKVDICSECHPFYTGKQKVLDTEGRIEKFNKKFGTGYRDNLKKNKKIEKK
jgi:large subunit ribosomal protein L31